MTLGMVIYIATGESYKTSIEAPTVTGIRSLKRSGRYA